MSIQSSQRTLVLDSSENRGVALQALRESGAKVLHDSGERVLVVEVPEEPLLRERLPGTSRLLELRGDAKKELPRASDNELLFVEALQLRASPAFQEEKRRRAPGSTPQEQLLFQASCIPEQNAR